MSNKYILIEKNKETGQEKKFLEGGIFSKETAESAKRIRELIRKYNGTLEKYDIYIKEI